MSGRLAASMFLSLCLISAAESGVRTSLWEHRRPERGFCSTTPRPGMSAIC